MQLLEREASLAGYAAEARRGGGRLVLVTGEAGVGKSALVEASRPLPGPAAPARHLARLLTRWATRPGTGLRAAESSGAPQVRPAHPEVRVRGA
jgi:hypothetical protein